MGYEYKYGEYPLYLVREGDTFKVSPASTGEAEQLGVRDGFQRDELPVMEARAIAQGYKLIIEDVPAAPAGESK